MIWRDVSGFKGVYQVSSAGQIYSFITNKILKPLRGPDGYHRIILYKNQNPYSVTVHKTVAIAFCKKPRSKQRLCVRHLDGDKGNNHKNNLKWGTYIENEADKKLHGKDTNKEETHYFARLKKADILKIRSSTLSHKNAAKKFKVTYGHIWAIRKFKTWRNVK